MKKSVVFVALTVGFLGAVSAETSFITGGSQNLSSIDKTVIQPGEVKTFSSGLGVALNCPNAKNQIELNVCLEDQRRVVANIARDQAINTSSVDATIKSEQAKQDANMYTDIAVNAGVGAAKSHADSVASNAFNSSKFYTDQKAGQILAQSQAYADSIAGGQITYFDAITVANSKTIQRPNGTINLASYVPSGASSAIVMLEMNTHWNLGGYVHVNGVEILRLHQAGPDYGLVVREVMELPAGNVTFASPNGQSYAKIIGYK